MHRMHTVCSEYGPVQKCIQISSHKYFVIQFAVAKLDRINCALYKLGSAFDSRPDSFTQFQREFIIVPFVWKQYSVSEQSHAETWRDARSLSHRAAGGEAAGAIQVRTFETALWWTYK